MDLFADRVVERQVGACRLLVLPTPVQRVVAWRGGFKSFPDFNAGEDLAQDLAVALLDKGTEARDRFEVAEVLEDRGAQLSFDGDSYRVSVTGRTLREHVGPVMEVMAEQLRQPLFDAQEFLKTRAQVAASLQRALESTGKQASGALARNLYPAAHPNYVPDQREQLAQLEALDIDDVRAFHRKHFGARDLILAVVGDVDPDEVAEHVERTLADWPDHEVPARITADASAHPPERQEVPIPDKQNVDVRLGHALHVRRGDDEYLPLYLANYILGGNFSARLMAVIRDEMGLTYGIGSRLSGVATEYDGHWQIGVTLSRENVERGLEAVRAEVERFVQEGATPDELDEKKTTVTGSFKVGLATTRGLAATLLRNAQRGFPIDYLDRFPRLIESVTLDELHEAVRRHFRPDQLHTALAGDLTADVDAEPA